MRKFANKLIKTAVEEERKNEKVVEDNSDSEKPTESEPLTSEKPTQNLKYLDDEDIKMVRQLSLKLNLGNRCQR